MFLKKACYLIAMYHLHNKAKVSLEATNTKLFQVLAIQRFALRKG